MVTSPNPVRKLGEEEIDRNKVERALKTRNAFTDVTHMVSTGKAPSNDMISKALHVAEESLDYQKTALGPGGRKIAEDTKKALISTERFLQERNEGEHLQTIWEEAFKLRETSPVGLSDAAKLKSAPSALSHELGLARDTLHNGKYVMLMLLNSGGFRSLVIELLSIISEALSPGTTVSSLKDENKTLKDAVTETLQSTREKMKVESFHLTDVQREHLRNRLQLVLQQLSSNLYFKRTVSSFFILMDTLKGDFMKTKEGTASIREKTAHSPELRNIMRELRAFFTQFIGVELMDRLVVLQKNLFREIRGDELTLNYFRDWRKLISSALDNPLILDQEEHRQEVYDLFQRGRDLNHKTRNWATTKELSAALRDAMYKISHDPINRQLTEDYRNLLRDVLFNEAGELSLNTEALGHLKNIFVPIVLDQLQYIPIPRIEKHRPDMDIIVDNLVFKAMNLLPDMIQITSATKMAVHPKSTSPVQELTSGTRTHLKIKARDIFVRLRDVRISYKRHHFPKMEDDMLVDIDVKRMKLKIVLDISKPPVSQPYQVPAQSGVVEGATKPVQKAVYGASGEIGHKTTLPAEGTGLVATKTGLFRTELVETRIGKLKLRARSGQHHSLFNFSTSLFSGMIRSRAEKAINLQILSAMDKINARLNQLMGSVLPKMTSTMGHRLGAAVSGVGAAVTGVGSAVKGGAMQLKKTTVKKKEEIQEAVAGGVPPPTPAETLAAQPEPTYSMRFVEAPREYETVFSGPSEQYLLRNAPAVSAPVTGPNAFEQVFGGKGELPVGREARVPQYRETPSWEAGRQPPFGERSQWGQPMRSENQPLFGERQSQYGGLVNEPVSSFEGKQEMQGIRSVETIILENPQTGETLIASATTMEFPEETQSSSGVQPEKQRLGTTDVTEQQQKLKQVENIDQSSITQGRGLKHVEPQL